MKKWTSIISLTFIVALVGVSFLGAGAAEAAPPYAVTYSGTTVNTAVPTKPVVLNLKVTNTGSTEYSGVSVIIHIPNGVTHSSVSPANSDIQDDTITWINVPIAAGETFSPSLTLTMDSGTAIGDKKNIWVEVTGEGMEANSQNFSLTAVSSVATTATAATTTLPSSTVDYLFSLVYDRLPASTESTYWVGRLADKSTRISLYGAMQFHKLLNITH